MRNPLPDLQKYRGFDEELLMDTTEDKPVYLLTAENGSHIRLSQSAYYLLQAVRSGLSFDEISEIINRRTETGDITEEQLTQAYDNILAELAKIEGQSMSRRLPWGFWFRFRLLPENIVCKIGSLLSNLYTLKLAAILLVFIVVAFCYTIYRGFGFHLSDGDLLNGYLIFLLSLFIHEFGHATACLRYGARPSDIGFTLYLIYPAFYSDVTAAWQLKRWQRVVVDLGGCFFQAALGSIFLFVFWLSGWEPLRIATLMILYSCVFSLNPIFKFDGYWVVSDALGVTNLARQPSRIGRYFLDKLLKRRPAPLPWPISITAILSVYSVISFSVWSYFLWLLFPTSLKRTTAFMGYVATVTSHLANRQVPSIPEVRSLFVSTMFLFIIAVMMWKVGKQLINSVIRRSYALLRKHLQSGKTYTKGVEFERP